MTEDETATPTSRARKRLRACLAVAALGAFIAILPFLIGAVGLMTGSQYLQTYHWLAFYSVPIGFGLTLLAAVAAFVIWIHGRSRRDGST